MQCVEMDGVNEVSFVECSILIFLDRQERAKANEHLLIREGGGLAV